MYRLGIQCCVPLHRIFHQTVKLSSFLWSGRRLRNGEHSSIMPRPISCFPDGLEEFIRKSADGRTKKCTINLSKLGASLLHGCALKGRTTNWPEILKNMTEDRGQWQLCSYVESEWLKTSVCVCVCVQLDCILCLLLRHFPIAVGQPPVHLGYSFFLLQRNSVRKVSVRGAYLTDNAILWFIVVSEFSLEANRNE